MTKKKSKCEYCKWNGDLLHIYVKAFDKNIYICEECLFEEFGKKEVEEFEKLKLKRLRRIRRIRYKNKERQMDMRIRAKELGKCSRCFKEKENPKFLMCNLCRKKRREYWKK